MTQFRTGMRVTAVGNTRYPGSGVVDKVNPRTIAVTLDSGLSVKYDRIFLVEEGKESDPDNALTMMVAGMGAKVETVPYVAPPQPGTVVEVVGSVVAREPKLGGLWIVCGGQGDKSRIFRLNNVDGRYWRIPNHELIKVNATVTKIAAR